MKRFIEGQDRNQSTLIPQSLEEYIDDDNTLVLAYNIRRMISMFGVKKLIRVIQA